GELTYLTDQIVTFGFSSLELRNKAVLVHSIPFLLDAAAVLNGHKEGIGRRIESGLKPYTASVG
ncbi:hypothetical protein FXE18_12435, partial [Vibrio cholerae]|uniref:hypothetical protein n=1 Tax=Vibrio cholerae TaxID=666 RepID=UPI0011D4E2B1